MRQVKRLLFAHDHRFYAGASGTLHSVGSFPSDVWDRYLRHFDRMTVIARDGGKVPPDWRLARSDHPDVDFRLLPNINSLAHLIHAPAEVRRAIEGSVHESDAVVARLPSEIGFLAIKAAQRRRKPYSVELVGCAWDGMVHHGSLAARLYAPLFFLRTRLAVLRAPRVLYVTSHWLQHRYPTRGESISASNVEVQPMDHSGRESRQQRLQELLSGRPPRLGTIASLAIESKGLRTGFEALAQLRNEGLSLSYAILGPGTPEPWRALAKEYGIADLVEFSRTRRAGREVCEWLDEIDIHLQPSLQEGLPRATIEAMSRGAACIGSDAGGIPELLPSAYIHRRGDATGLRACLRMLIDNPNVILEASAANLRASEPFNSTVLTRRRDRFYRRLRQAI